MRQLCRVLILVNVVAIAACTNANVGTGGLTSATATKSTTSDPNTPPPPPAFQLPYLLQGIFAGSIGYSSGIGSGANPCPASGPAYGWCTGGLFTGSASNGGYNGIQGIAIDSNSGFMYVADTYNNRIVKSRLSDGLFIGAIGYTNGTTGTCPSSGPTLSGWCTGGSFTYSSTDGGLFFPKALAVDVGSDGLYVLDNSNRISKFNLGAGTFAGAVGYLSSTGGTGASPCPSVGAASSWCTSGTFVGNNLDGGYSSASSIAVDLSTSNIYVFDGTYGKISKLNKFGHYLGGIGYATSAGAAPCTLALTANQGWCTGATFTNLSSAAGEGFFSNGAYLAVDGAHGFLYVADTGNYHIQKINLSTGLAIGTNGAVSNTSTSCSQIGVGNSWCTNAIFAASVLDGGFMNLKGIAIDPTGSTLYVIDNYRIQQISAATGQILNGSIGEIYSPGSNTCAAYGAAMNSVAPRFCLGSSWVMGSGDGEFATPGGLAIDATSGYLYVTDASNSRIQRFK